jgi:hypothetical protein
MKKILFFLLLFAFPFVQSCDLEEEIFDEALNASLLESKTAAEGVLAPVYSRMVDLFNDHNGYFMLQENSTDECIVPFRGGTDWFNGGVLIEIHRHTWTSSLSNTQNTWNQLTQGIARALIAQKTLASLNSPNSALYSAESRAMAAFYNSLLLDLFNVVFVKSPEDIPTTGGVGKESAVLKDGAAFDYLIAELDAAEGALQTKREVGHGRMTKGAIWALKARLYLNRAVYLNRYVKGPQFAPADMDKVIENADKVINSGIYDLEKTDYFKIFDLDNGSHPEIIFALKQIQDNNNGGRFTWFSLARNHHFSLTNRGSTGTDGGSITSDFWNTWANNKMDPRFYKEVIKQDGSVTSIPTARWAINRGLLQGQQYGIVLAAGGADFKKAANGDLAIEALRNTFRTGEMVNFSVAVDLETNTGHSQGVRVSKFAVDPLSTQGRNINRVDIPILRMGDIYLMRAEAKLRKGDAAGALADVNAVRTARKHPVALTQAEMTLDNMFRERGFELYWEMLRRTDMIRFGKYEDTWTSKTDNNPNRRTYLIPQAAIDANPSLLQQNPQ